ncbi:MAG: NfeD family protein [Pirellulaceae bacterium]|nr:NfeD family protein [Pirellulaceae bacterium]
MIANDAVTAIKILSWLIWMIALGSSSRTSASAQEKLAAPERVVLIEFNGPIQSLSEQYLYRKLDEAERLKADVVVIEIDSPGGEVEATMRIAAKLRDLPFARTVAYIPREALSGAALFALGCDEIVLGPQAVFGDAGPVFMREDFLFRHAPEKIRTDLARRVRDLAESQNRPPALAEAMVDMDLEVFQVQNEDTGQQTFMSQAEIDASDAPEAWKIIKPVLESRKAHFLEVNGRRAVELDLADANVSDRKELQERYRAKEWVDLEWNAVDQAVLILNNPFMTGALLVVALIALYIEFLSPGLGIGGLVATICFGLFFWSRFLGGTAEWLEVILCISGIALIVVELFVIPGFGIWGITGITLFTLGLVFASEPFLIPETGSDLNSLGQSLLILISAALVFLIAAVWITTRLGSIPVLNRFTLAPPKTAISESLNTQQAKTEITATVIEVGQIGITESPLRPAGKVAFGEDYLDVTSDGTFVDAGEQVRVIKIQGNRVVVRRLEQN